MELIWLIIIGIILILFGLFILVNITFRWDRFSQKFPLEWYPKWKVNMTKYVYETYGDKGLRKYFLFLFFLFTGIGILFCVRGTKEMAERGQIEDFPQIWEGDTVPFAGGMLTLDEVGMPDRFTAMRFNLDENRYEEVEVKADMHGEHMLLFKTRLTNNSSETLRIVHEDLKFYAKPPEEGNNINGRAAVDGYLYHDNPIELEAGERVSVWFWLSLTEEELNQSFWFVLQYGSTGCLVGNGQKAATIKNMDSPIDNTQRVSEQAGYVGYQDLDIDAYVTLNDYKNMKVSVHKPAIKDEDIEQYINSELLKGDITDRAVEYGDVINIDYAIGKYGEDGEVYEDSMASGYELEIGSGSSIEGLEEGLIGAMPGDAVDLNLVLEGEPAVLTVVVNSIVRTKYANVSDEDLERLGLSYENKEALWEAAKAEVEKNAEEEFADSKINAILEQVLSESTIKSVPEYLVEELIQEVMLGMEATSKSYYGADFEQYLEEIENKTLDEFVVELRPECKRKVKWYLISEALARAEGIELTDDLLREYAKKEIMISDNDMADLYIDSVGYTMYRMSVLQEMLGERFDEMITVEEITEE